MKSKGLIIGKFAPLHLGHEYLIQQAVKSCNELAILLCYNSKFDNEIDVISYPSLSFDMRKQYLNNFIQSFEDKSIYFFILDENCLEEYQGEDKCSEFFRLCTHKLRQHEYEPDCIFTGEQGYVEKYRKYLPHLKVSMITRNENFKDISATKIRNLMKHKNSSLKEFVSSFVLSYLGDNNA